MHTDEPAVLPCNRTQLRPCTSKHVVLQGASCLQWHSVDVMQACCVNKMMRHTQQYGRSVSGRYRFVCVKKLWIKPERLTVSASVIPWVTSKCGHVSNVVSVTHQLLKAPVCFADVLSLKAVIQCHHWLHSICLQSSMTLHLTADWANLHV